MNRRPDGASSLGNGYNIHDNYGDGDPIYGITSGSGWSLYGVNGYGALATQQDYEDDGAEKG